MTNAIFFDLDNTLILFDEVKFFKAYIHKVAPIMSDIGSPATLWQMVLKSTKAVLHNDGKLTNKDVFFRTFTKGLEDQTQEIWNRFLRFYHNEFDQLKTMVIVNKGVTEIFSILSKRNIKIVIASNPFWPRVAMEKRMEWAGLDKEKVDLVTHMENMHFCKPRLEYYLEICNIINEQPEDCLMVGDDPINDMIAGKLKMKTYLTTDHQKFKSQFNTISEKIRFGFRKNSHRSDYKGPLIQLKEILPQLI